MGGQKKKKRVEKIDIRKKCKRGKNGREYTKQLIKKIKNKN